MNDQVKELLAKHGYKVKLSVNTETGLISLHIPARIQEPETEPYTHDYLITDNKVYMSMNNEDAVEVQCPTYACRSLVFVDIRRVCQCYHFSTSLLEFYNGQDKISETEFFNLMLPKSVAFDEQMRKQERDLVELLTRAMHAILPYHDSFNYEAEQMGIGLGYGLIATFALGGNDE